MARFISGLVAVLAVLFVATVPAQAQLSGAIFTTNSTGSEVNGNIYQSKFDVYLSGGPPPGAPPTAAGLPDGTYVFQVTDPPGKTLLSLDIANCRQFTVLGGNINGVVKTGCQHLTGLSVDGETTVQLMPYADTPNNGGEYKAWATPLANYLQGCADLGVANGLAVVDCGITPGDIHGFIPRHSKTDNFKVKNTQEVNEVDTEWFDSNNNPITGGLCETWIDTLGVANTKCIDPKNSNPVTAHVEVVETGVHQFVFTPQPGCMSWTGGVSQYVGGKLLTTQTFSGPPTTVDITIKPNFSGTISIVLYCAP